MTCPHGTRSQPATCSQCLAIPARVVTTDGPVVLVDGKPVRAMDPEGGRQSYYARRGGKQHGRREKP